MALDEFIFGKFVKLIKNKPVDDAILHRTVWLKDIQTRLTVLARVLTAQPIDIFPAIKEGGFKGNNFFLPERFSFYLDTDLNLQYYIYRVLFLSVQKANKLNWFQKQPLPDAAALQLAIEHSPKVLESLFLEYPVAASLYDSLVNNTQTANSQPIEINWLVGRWMVDISEPDRGNTIHTNIKTTSKDTLPKTTIKSKPVEEIINLIIDTKQQEDYVLTHNFEKVDTADEFSGSWRDFDGDDELEEHQDALKELNLKYTVRSDDTTHSVYEADFTENAQVAESKEAEAVGNYISYDEWDYRKKGYRINFSKVFPTHPIAFSDEYCQQCLEKNNGLLMQLRKQLTNLNNKWQQQRLQIQGNEVDIDMAVNRFADIISGHTPSDKIYLSDRKIEKDLSILLLLDNSLSSDSYAAGNRVIDVEKQTAILFGEILHEYKIDFAVHSFYSKTRNYTAFVSLKDFDSDWKIFRNSIGALQPEGYTRIGPALRHAGRLLSKRNSKNKWVIVLSDGKPNDYDRYEGQYGINDIKQALRELNEQSINTYALAIEANARYYLPQMFGQNHFQIVSSPAELIKSLVKLYEKIKHHS